MFLIIRLCFVFSGVLLSSVFAQAQFEFISGPSTVPGVEIRNFHYVLQDRGQLYRGAQPRGLEDEARQVVGINEVLIFKNENWGEVENEIKAWKSLGLASNRIHHIPFEWNNPEPKLACKQLIQGLKLARASLKDSRSRFYIHCSAGEDRTGIFVGSIRMLLQGWPHEKVFDEMCSYGYADGNFWKPWFIKNRVKAGLTPLFLKMAYLIENRRLSWDNLDPRVCNDIEAIPPLDNPERFNCP